MNFKFLLPLGVLLIALNSSAQVSMTGVSGTYTQDFNTLPTSGSPVWTDNSTVSNWYSQRTGTGNTIVAGNGGATAGALYSFGTGTTTERALGTIGSGTPDDMAHGVLLQNNTGSALTSLTITYTGEQWRNSAATAQTMTFWYKVSATPITVLDPFINTTWTAVTSLDFTTPIVGGTAGALDGDLPANRTTLSAPIPSIALANGEYIMLKWDDPDHTGTDHGLSIDDVSIDWSSAPACTPPVGAPTLFTSSNITNTTADIGWTLGSSGNVIVVAHTGTPVSSDPVSGVTYTANAAFGSGTQIGSGNYVVYNGTGTSVSVTGLSAGTTYYFSIYEYDPNAGSPCYLLTDLSGNITTTGTAASCFEIESFLADACNASPPCAVGATEGENEMVRFKVGSAPLNTTDLNVTWPSNSWLGVEMSSAITTPIVNALNSTITACGYLKEPVGGILPAGSTVLLITSTNMCAAGNSFANLTDTLYIIFQVAGNTSGHFLNYNTTPGTFRTLTMSFSSPPSCSDAVTYDANLLINQMGGYGGTAAEKDGGAVEFSPAGTATYVNYGCQAPFVPLDIEAGNDLSVCFNGSASLLASTTNQYTSIAWSGGTGNFSSAGTLATNYSPGVGDVGTIKIYVELTGACGVTVMDSLMITINPAPSPTVTANIASATVCSGDPITLTASGGTSYAWIAPVATTNTITVNPTTSTVYTVDVTNACSTTQATFSVTVNDLPVIAASNTGAYCVKDSIYLSETLTTGLSYNWSGPNSFSSAVQNPFIANATAATAGTYSLTVTDNNSCQNTTTTTVVVNALPTFNSAGLTITPATCGLADGDISGVGAVGSNGTNYTYYWTASNGGVITPMDSVLTDTTGGVYYLVATEIATGCKDSTSFTIPTLGGPTIPVFTATSPVCEGAGTTLSLTPGSVTAGATYIWTLGTDTLQNGIDLTSLVLDTATAGPYNVTVVTGGCGNSANTTITIKTSPIPTITGTLSFCAGTSTVLDASTSSPSTGNTYQWYLNGSPIGGETAVTYTATAAGNYQVLVTNTGCDSLSTASVVSVYSLPIVNTTSSPVVNTNAGCGLSNGSITFASASGSAPFTYQWTDGAGTSLSSDSTLSNAGAGNYYLLATDNNGCTDSSIATISAPLPPAVPTFDPAPSVCEGSTFSLSVNNDLAGATYTWTATGVSTQTGVDLTSINVTDANATNVGTYTVAVSVDACVATSTVSATFNPRPVPQILSTGISFCSGSTLTLTGSPASGVSYQWYFNNNPVSGETNATYNAGQAGDYQLYINDGTCDSLSSVTVITENSLPLVTVNSPSYCINAASQLVAAGAQTYSWSAGTTPSTGTTVSVPTTGSGLITYTVTGTDANGCSNTAIASVTVNADPVIMINSLQNGTDTICENSVISLTASGGTSYVWSTTETSNPISYTTATSAIVSVVGTDANGCTGTTDIQIEVDPAPVPPTFVGAPTICNGYPTILSLDTIVADHTYSWLDSFGNVLTTDDSLTINSVGSYSLVCTNSCGSYNLPIVIGQSSIQVSFDPDTTLGLAPLPVNFTNTSSGADYYYWLFGNGDTSNLANPNTIYQTPGTYTAYLLGSNAAFCYASYSVQIIVLETSIGITVPNVFSPNGDELNDFFGFQSYGIKEFNCSIFNRWGTQVADLKDINDKWTPASDVSEGTYFYILKAKGIDDKDYSSEGYVLLVK